MALDVSIPRYFSHYVVTYTIKSPERSVELFIEIFELISLISSETQFRDQGFLKLDSYYLLFLLIYGTISRYLIS